jgi:hypothetical protein
MLKIAWLFTEKVRVTGTRFNAVILDLGLRDYKIIICTALQCLSKVHKSIHNGLGVLSTKNQNKTLVFNRIGFNIFLVIPTVAKKFGGFIGLLNLQPS